MRRWRERYEEGGFSGLFDRRGGKPSPKRVPMAVVERSLLTPNRWLELSPYLDQALAIPERERAVWLQSFREKNPELGELLKSLLDEHRVMAERKFIEKSLDIALKPSGLSGRVIGAYPLISRIGQGGMGTVWLAERNDGRFER